MSRLRQLSLLDSVAMRIADYREGEIPRPSAEHVGSWVAQFEPEDQLLILEETDRVLGRFYVSGADAERYVSKMLEHEKIIGLNPPQDIQRVSFPAMQRKGRSQKDLLECVDRVMRKKHGFGVDQCGKDTAKHVYFDDCLLTGNTCYHDVSAWRSTQPPGAELHLVFFATHSRGVRYLSNRLTPRPTIWSLHTFKNLPWETTEFDCFWPSDVAGDGAVAEYAAALTARCQGKSFAPRLFRPAGTPAKETVFSSPAARVAVEHAFLKAGVRIISWCQHPKPQMRPMGYEYLESLGFGALVATYRNCPNNCPLVWWWGDPEAPKNHPLRRWYPLLPRKTNAPAVSDVSWLAKI